MDVSPKSLLSTKFFDIGLLRRTFLKHKVPLDDPNLDSEKCHYDLWHVCSVSNPCKPRTNLRMKVSDVYQLITEEYSHALICEFGPQCKPPVQCSKLTYVRACVARFSSIRYIILNSKETEVSCNTITKILEYSYLHPL